MSFDLQHWQFVLTIVNTLVVPGAFALGRHLWSIERRLTAIEIRVGVDHVSVRP